MAKEQWRFTRNWPELVRLPIGERSATQQMKISLKKSRRYCSQRNRNLQAIRIDQVKSHLLMLSATANSANTRDYEYKIFSRCSDDITQYSINSNVSLFSNIGFWLDNTHIASARSAPGGKATSALGKVSHLEAGTQDQAVDRHVLGHTFVGNGGRYPS